MKLKKLAILIILSGIVIASVLLISNRFNGQKETTSLELQPQVGGVQTEETVAVKNITPPEANSLINNKQNLIIIDVRTTQEYAQGHLENAVNFDYPSPNFKGELNKLDKNKMYLVYCQSGRRSQSASALMKDLGFNAVYNIVGGINQWNENNLPVIK